MKYGEFAAHRAFEVVEPMPGKIKKRTVTAGQTFFVVDENDYFAEIIFSTKDDTEVSPKELMYPVRKSQIADADFTGRVLCPNEYGRGYSIAF